jgi:hypothetical protein
MRRKPTETVQVNLRIKESERRKLEAAALRNGVSLNAEMAARLARTFRQTAALEIDQLAENVGRYLGPLVANTHDLMMSGEAARAVDELIALVQPLLAVGSIAGPAGAEIRAAIDKILVNKHAVEIEARLRLIKIGAQS